MIWSKGRGIESRSFSLLIEHFRLFVYSILFSRIDTFHVANDLSTRKCDGSVEKGTPCETRKKDQQAFQEQDSRKDELVRFEDD